MVVNTQSYRKISGERPNRLRTGTFDFDLQWTPDETRIGGSVPKLDRTDIPPSRTCLA